jgi:hypothetical protein
VPARRHRVTPWPMDQRQGSEDEDEASSRAVNAQPWEPMPGMVKQQCPRCRYFFAAAPANEERRCPDCAGWGTRAGR